jgi:hypothetical protein
LYFDLWLESLGPSRSFAIRNVKNQIN